MEDYPVMFWPFLIPIVGIIAGVTYGIVGTLSRHRLRELEIRERIAMIERGLVPPPEVDPRGFDHAMGHMDQINQARDMRDWRREARRGTGRHQRAGIIVMGIGFGLMVMIGFSGGDPGAAIGVGGFLVIMGAAFLINGLFENRSLPPAAGPSSFGSTTPAPTPPGPIDSPRRD
jgi:hypothetical protein